MPPVEPPASSPTSSPSRASLALARRVLVGTSLGVTYAVVNDVLDALWKQGGVSGPFSALHAAVDQAIPVLTGALLGVAVHHAMARSELAAEAQRRASDLRGRLQRVERDQAAWVVAAATLHEVRNPLHALGLVLDELDAAVPRGQADARALVASAQAQLDRVAEHLSRLRGIPSAGPPAPVAFDLGALLAGLVDERRPHAARERIALERSIEADLTALGDPGSTRVIVENLVDNALDALAGRGEGRVRVEASREGEFAVVSISDDGPGPAPELVSRLFEPLHSTKATGLGLGLSIARTLARSMRGDLTFTPCPTTFTLTLPAT